MAGVVQERLLTADELAGLPDDGRRHELVAGRLLSEPPAGYRHGGVAVRIVALLDLFVRSRGLGRVVTCDTGFVLARDPDTVRAPDVAFVAAESEKRLGGGVGFFPGAPDLAVEVCSPGDPDAEVHAKVADYLAAGTRLVWVVDPAATTVTVYRALLSPRVLAGDDRLDAADLLPGFSVAIAEIFAD